jgi:hypothetical protein
MLIVLFAIIFVNGLVLTSSPYNSVNVNVTNQDGFSYLNLSSLRPFNNTFIYSNFDVNRTSSGIEPNLANASINGTINANVIYNSTGAFGGAYDFSAGSSILSYGDQNLFDSAQDITFSAWVKTNSANSDDYVLSKSDGFGNGGFIFFRDDVSSVSSRTDVWRLTIYDFNDADEITLESATGSASANNLTHLAFVYSKTNNNVTLYVNSVPVVYSATSAIGSHTGSNSALTIGGTSLSTAEFDGWIDDVMIIFDYLNGSQIQELYNSQSKRFTSEGTQTFLNQNVSTTGDENRINISLGGYVALMGANISVSLDEGLNYTTFPESGVLNNLEIISDPNAINLTFKYDSGSDQFYTPLLIGNITLASYDGGGESDFISPTIIIHSPSNNSFTQNENITINISASDNVAVDSCWWSEDFGETNNSFVCDNNISGETWSGRVILEVWVNDTSGRISSDSVTFEIDNVSPLISFAGSNPEDYSNITNTFFTINLTITETNFQNMSVKVFNSSGLYNQTDYLSLRNEITFVGLPYENYTYNVTISDKANNINTTNTLHINIIQSETSPLPMTTKRFGDCVTCDVKNVTIDSGVSYFQNTTNIYGSTSITYREIFSNAQTGLYYFNLSSIPENSDVVDARLVIFVDSSFAVATGSIVKTIHVLNDNSSTGLWNETTVNYNTKNGSTTWDDGPLSNSLGGVSSKMYFKTWTNKLSNYVLNANMTEAVQYWVDNPDKNIGFALGLNATGLNIATYSREATDESLRPYLQITYNGSQEEEIDSPTNISVNQYSGQTFITWIDINSTKNDTGYYIYRSTSPINSTNLINAERLGFVRQGSSWLSDDVQGLSSNIRQPNISKTGAVLGNETGLYVYTNRANETAYYAVTTVEEGNENREIVPGDNYYDAPTSESTEMIDAYVFRTSGVYTGYIFWLTNWNPENQSDTYGLDSRDSNPFFFSLVEPFSFDETKKYPITFYLHPATHGYFDSAEGYDNCLYVDEDRYGGYCVDFNSFDRLVFKDAYGYLRDMGGWIEDYGYAYSYYSGWNTNYQPSYRYRDIIKAEDVVEPLTDGYNVPYTEKAMIFTLHWLKNYSDFSQYIDQNRVYSTGGSMGAGGSMALGVHYPEEFASINGVQGRTVGQYSGFEGAVTDVYYGPETDNITMPDGTPIYDYLNISYWIENNLDKDYPYMQLYHGKADSTISWELNYIVDFLQKMDNLKYPKTHYWDNSTHNSFNRSLFPEIIPSRSYVSNITNDGFNILNFWLNQSYPAFSNSSINDNPGNGTKTEGDLTGGYNRFLWYNRSSIIDNSTTYKIDLYLLSESTTVSNSTNVSVTPVRIQNFPNTALGDYSYTYMEGSTLLSSGTVEADSYGRITVDDIEVTGDMRTLTLTEYSSGGEDTTYPYFFNYTDNNGSLTDSGLGQFNVNVENTNGSVYLNINGESIQANNISGWYNATYTFSSSGVYVYNWTAYGNGTSHLLNTSDTRSYTVNQTEADNNYPIFSNEDVSPNNNSVYVFNTPTIFNITITSTNGTGGIEFDGVNYSLTNVSSLFSRNLGALSVGSYDYYFWAYGNGTDKLFNKTITKSYVIQKATPTGSITGTSPITYPTSRNVEGSESNSGDDDLTYQLFRDGTLVSNPDTGIIGVGSYDYVYNTTGGTNYSSSLSLDSFTLTVNQASSSINLTLDNTESNVTIVEGESIYLNVTRISGDSSGRLTLYREGVLLNNGTSPIYNLTTFSSVGVYNITAYYEGSQNYSLSSSTYFVNVSTGPDTVNPSVKIYSPSNKTYHNDSITLNYSASDSIELDSVWYSIVNSTLDVIEGNTSLESNISLNISSNGIYFVRVYANDSSGNINGSELSQFTINNTKKIILYEKFRGRGSTSQLDDISEEEISNLSDLIIEDPNYAKIEFNENVSLIDDIGENNKSDFDSNINLSFNRIEINSSVLMSLNKSATLTLYGLTFNNPRILKDGSVCSSTECVEVSYSGGTLVFNVTGFSVYSSEETPSDDVVVGGGGGGGGGIILDDDESWENINEYDDIEFSGKDPYIKSLGVLDAVRIMIDSEKHIVGVVQINSNYVIVNVSSETQQKKINLGESEDFDVDLDGTYEIRVKVNEINYPLANLRISHISGDIIFNDDEAEDNTEEIGDNEVNNGEKSEENENNKSFRWIFVLVGILLVVVLFVISYLIYIMVRNRYRKHWHRNY